MNNSERKTLENNAELIDALFCLMFETLWVAPYDRRRNAPALGEFERCVRRLVMFLSTPDVPGVSSAGPEKLEAAVTELETCFGRVADARIFPAEVCTEAAEAVQQISASVRALCESELRV